MIGRDVVAPPPPSSSPPPSRQSRRPPTSPTRASLEYRRLYESVNMRRRKNNKTEKPSALYPRVPGKLRLGCDDPEQCLFISLFIRSFVHSLVHLFIIRRFHSLFIISFIHLNCFASSASSTSRIPLPLRLSTALSASSTSRIPLSLHPPILYSVIFVIIIKCCSFC